VRNAKGQQLLQLVEPELETAEVTSGGDRRAAVQQGIEAYDKALKLPLWLAELVGFFVQRFGPKGLEYGRFSIDSHFTRNALWLRRNHPEKAEAQIPAFAKKIIGRYRLPAA
jgi:coenzyme F420 hydrogenase subunit beta